MDRTGIAAALAAYAAWGVLPLYWRLLKGIDAPQLLAHRILWSFVGLSVGLALAGRMGALVRRLDRSTVRAGVIAAALVGTNWLMFVWGVTNDRVVEVSLGYFLNPMVNVVLGVVVLRERLTAGQWGGVAIAGAGVAVALIGSGALPWIALGLAVTFGGYSLAKKLAPLDAFESLWLESALLAAPSAAALAWASASGVGAFGAAGTAQDLLLIGTGLVTAGPLVLFGVAARRIPLSVVGFLQYLSPSIQLMLGVWVFHEPFGWIRAASFGLVWAGLVVWVAAR